MFLFGFFSAMSGQQFFADAPYQLYNVVYTALPILFVAVFDKLLPAQFLQDNPRLYQLQKHSAFDPMIFSGWILRAFLHAIVLFFIPYFSFGIQNISQSHGRADGIWYFSVTVYYCTVLTPTLLIMYDMANVTFLHWVALTCSVVALFLITWIMNLLNKLVPDLDDVVTTIDAPSLLPFLLLSASLLEPMLDFLPASSSPSSFFFCAFCSASSLSIQGMRQGTRGRSLVRGLTVLFVCAL